MNRFLVKVGIILTMVVSWGLFWDIMSAGSLNYKTDRMVSQQLGSEGNTVMVEKHVESAFYSLGWLGISGISFLMFWPQIKHCWKHMWLCLLLGLTVSGTTGCGYFVRPFEPVILEQIGSNEEGFLISYKSDKQTQTNSAELLEKSLVQSKQVQIPQQWVPKGYERMGANGSWKPAAILVKVDRSPVTCSWTADPNTGTGKQNEAIWVMTSDQVEFSTGWTCTGRIATREDCIKFLYNYPNGSIKTVMDSEVRALVQTTFGLEVTDQPMTKLRSEATPHIQTVVVKVTEFFHERGLTITNLGISGGFIYTDKKISDRMTELFVAEQGQAVAVAKASALQKEAEGLASAAKLKARGEADAIQAIADAKAYEITKATEHLAVYIELKRLELEKAKLEKWNGKFPEYYIGNTSPDMLLTLPATNHKVVE